MFFVENPEPVKQEQMWCDLGSWCVGYRHAMYPSTMMTQMRDNLDPRRVLNVCPECSIKYAKSRGNVKCTQCEVWQNPIRFRYTVGKGVLMCFDCFMKN